MRLRITIQTGEKQRKYTVHIGRTGKTTRLRAYCDKIGINYQSIAESMQGWPDGHYQKDFDDLMRKAIMRAQQKLNKRYYACASCRGFGWHRESATTLRRVDCKPCEGTGRLDNRDLPYTDLNEQEELVATVAQVDQMQAKIEEEFMNEEVTQ